MDDKLTHGDGKFYEHLIDKFLEHPELIRSIMDAYFDNIDLETCCWRLLATTDCTAT